MRADKNTKGNAIVEALQKVKDTMARIDGEKDKLRVELAAVEKEIERRIAGKPSITLGKFGFSKSADFYYSDEEIARKRAKLKNVRAEVVELMTAISNQDVIDRCNQFLKRMEQYEKKIRGQIAVIENCIESIPDADEREMARLYFVDLLGYEEIGDRLFMDRTTVARRIKKHADKWTCFDNQSIPP